MCGNVGVRVLVLDLYLGWGGKKKKKKKKVEEDRDCAFGGNLWREMAGVRCCVARAQEVRTKGANLYGSFFFFQNYYLLFIFFEYSNKIYLLLILISMRYPVKEFYINMQLFAVI